MAIPVLELQIVTRFQRRQDALWHTEVSVTV
jgi:hypothetical protein